MISNICWAQDYPHISIWMDEYTIRHHCTQYLANKAGQREHLRHWDGSLQTFVSSIPANLTYPPAAGKKLDVTNHEIDYRDEYQLLKWELFSPERFDSILEKNKVLSEIKLHYDENGRLLTSAQKNKKPKLGVGNKTFSFQYEDSSDFHKLRFNLKSKEFRLFGRYSSIYAGNFNYRPLRLRSHWEMDYLFDSRQRLLHAHSISTSKANQRKNSPPGYFDYTYKWDDKGHLIQRDYYASNDSVEKHLEQNFEEQPFDLEVEKENYAVLKTPAIERWLLNEYKSKGLKIIEYVGERNSGRYIVDGNEQPIILLGKTEKSRKIFYQTLVDSNSIFKSEFYFYKLPDTTDKIPYDPHYKRRLLETRHTLCSVVSTYSSPPGLLYGRETKGYKKSFLALNGGWSLVLYQSGASDGYGRTPFAIGHRPLIRLDVRYDKYVILDPEGKVAYFGSYRKMSKVNW